MHRSVYLALLAALGIPLAVGAVLSLFWPGPLALDDRLPLVLLFGIPVVVIAEKVRAELG